MTIHHHGGPFTPLDVLYTLTGRHFCCSHARPEQVARMHDIGQSVMLDNGAWSVFKRGHQPDWNKYYAWTDRWLHCPTTWAVVPDVIDGGSQLQDALLREWPHGKRQSAPVFHLDENLPRLLRLCDEGWDRVCLGSTAEFFDVMGESWERRVDDIFNQLALTFGRIPRLHMLRGMRCSGKRWPFYSLDSTDVAQNHNRPQNTARAMAERWDAMQCPGPWVLRPEQMELC